MSEIAYLPAQANDDELWLLGAAMGGYPRLDDLLDAVEPGDFYQPHRGEIWEAIARTHAGGTQPTVTAVRESLDRAKVRNDPVALFDLVANCPLVAQGPLYAEHVVEAAGKRRLQSAGVRVSQAANAASLTLDEAREEARRALDEATAGKARSHARTLAQALPDVLDVIQSGTSPALSTRWPDLDRTIGGLAPGRLVVVGARPGEGKSLSGFNLATHFAGHHGHAVLVCSMEMPEDEVIKRMIADWASVDLTQIQTGTVDEAGWDRIARHHQEVLDLPITIDDTPHQSVTHIAKTARDVQRARDDLALIVVDYLQLIAVTGKPGASRAEEVSGIARDLKLLARDTGACVLGLAQVNRAGANNASGKPRLTDLREGGIENDADQVILLHRPDLDLPEVEVNVAKNRHGPIGTSRLLLQGHYARLASVEWNPTRSIR